ncbi:MAG: YjbH domain-containing protein [Sphingomonadales bacterium]
MRFLRYAKWSIICLIPAVANAQNLLLNSKDNNSSPGVFGGAGLLEMRSARFLVDGTLSVGAAYLDGINNYYSTWQATPWLETTLRYSDYDGTVGGVDKGFDIKFKLLEEGAYRPAIGLGFQDFLGNGIFSSEYLVASKRIYDFDVTLGLGFGQLANRSKLNNIARLFGSSFNSRNSDVVRLENFKFGNYFSGKNMGFFWGIEYYTPIEGLSAKVEYSTIDKSKIKVFENYKSKTAFNFGLNYKVKNWLELGAGLLHGNKLSLQISIKQNLHKPIRLKFAKGPEIDEIRFRELKNNAKNINNYKDNSSPDMIFERIERMGYDITNVQLKNKHIDIVLTPNKKTIQDNEVILGAILENYYSTRVTFPNNIETANLLDDNGKKSREIYRGSSFYAREFNLNDDHKVLISNTIFNNLNNRKLSPIAVEISNSEMIITKNVAPFIEMPKNIGRTVRILTNDAPDNIEKISILSKSRGLNLPKVSLFRKDFENIAKNNGSPEEILANAIIEKPDNNKKRAVSTQTFPSFEYGVFPDFETHFGSEKNNHFKGDLNLKIFGRVNLNENLQIYAEAQQHLIGNLDLVPRSKNNNANHVRSNVGLYSAQGTTSLRRLSLEYITNPLEGVYTRVTAGHLEKMYSGVSGEILYRPYGASISFGAEVNYVKQRGYEQLFDMRNYETLTGHATVYHVNKKYDLTSRISFGRYLAKDWGTTIDISRRFSSGIRIGVSTTYTNLKKSESGRGYSDNQIYMIIPFDFFWFKQSSDKASFKFKRLGKNGGQKIEHSTDLFGLLSNSQPYVLRKNWNEILN